MINQQLLTYISSQQEAGIDDETIKDNLQSAGWREEDIDEGFQAVANDLDGGNSTAAHQEIREEASKQRGGQSAVGQGSDTGDAAETDQSSDDSYREPIEEEDTAGPAAASGDSSLSPIDEETSDNNAGQSRELGQSSEGEFVGGSDQGEDNDMTTTDMPEDESGQSDSDNVDTDTESGADQSESAGDTQPEEAKGADTTSGPEDINDSDSSNPLESHEKMKEIGAQSGGADSGHDTEPVAVRTFQSDSQKAGGDEGSKTEVDHPAARKKAAADDQSDNDDQLKAAAASVAAAGTSKDQGDKQSDDSKPKSGSPKAGAEVKKGDDGPQQRKKPSSSRPTMDTISDDEKPSRDTADGKRRFAASKNPSAVKRRAAKQRGGSSSSSWISILLFIFALVLVGGGGAYAYMTFFQTSSPEVTAEEAVRSLAEAGSFNFRTMIEEADGDSVSNRTVIEGAVDLDQNTDAQSYYTITSEDQEMPIQAIMAETENMATVPAIQRETVRDILFTPDFFSIGAFQTQERLGQTSDSDGFLTNRFGVSLNSSQLVSDYATLHQALFDNALSQEVLSNLQATVSQFEPTQGQAWLDAETNVPYQITFIGTGPEGQDMQVNLQFKNHGSAIETTPSYEPRSGEQVLSNFFNTDSSEDTEDQSETSEEDDDATTTPSETSSDDETSEGEETADEEGQESEIADSQLRRWDRLRLNDLQQIAIALRVYGNDNDSYPDNLQALLSEDDSLLTEVPRDPASGNAYSYSISEDGSRYHIGATLQILTRSSTSGDANFNSRGQGFPNGFNGAAASCQSSSAIDPVSTCYDLSGSLE